MDKYIIYLIDKLIETERSLEIVRGMYAEATEKIDALEESNRNYAELLQGRI